MDIFSIEACIAISVIVLLIVTRERISSKLKKKEQTGVEKQGRIGLKKYIFAFIIFISVFLTVVALRLKLEHIVIPDTVMIFVWIILGLLILLIVVTLEKENFIKSKFYSCYLKPHKKHVEKLKHRMVKTMKSWRKDEKS